MTPEQLREFALMGARARLATLDEEREIIIAAFPELHSRPRRLIAGAAAPSVIFDAHAEPVLNGHNKPFAANERQAASIALARQGIPVRDIAARVRVDTSTVYKTLARAGVEPARRSGQRKLGRPAHQRLTAPSGTAHITPNMRTKALALLRSGTIVAEVARVVGVTETSIRRWRDEANIKPSAQPSKPSAKPISGKRRQYDYEFKMKAIALAKEKGSAYEAARILGIPQTNITNWQSRGVPKKPPASRVPTITIKPEPEPAKKPELPPRGAGYVMRRRAGSTTTLTVGAP